MPKVKTNSSVKKRFKKASGGYKRRCANRNHNLTKKSSKRKRKLRGLQSLSAQGVRLVNKMFGRS